MKIYGGCIEPEGRFLENYIMPHDCKMCGGRGSTRFWEAAEGGCLNHYFSTWCEDCDHKEGNGGDGSDDYDDSHMSPEDYAAIYAELDEILEDEEAEEDAPPPSPPPLTFRQKLVEIAKGLWH